MMQLEFLFGIVLGFLDRTVSSAMGYFVGCFRIGDDRRLPASTSLFHSRSSCSTSMDAVNFDNCEPSLFLVEEKEVSPLEECRNHSSESPIVDKELRDEAKFLKACGTIAGTPAEIRKVSQELDVSSSKDGRLESSKFHSWLSETSIGDLPLVIGLHQSSSPKISSEESGTTSPVSEHTPSSCISNAQNTGLVSRLSTESTEGSGTRTAQSTERTGTSQTVKIDTPLPCQFKSVRFDFDDVDMSSSGSSSATSNQSTKKIGTPGSQSAYNPHVYPTPQKLSNTMQTPGTVFPTALENLPNGKSRVRSQFVYPVYNSVEDDFQRKVHQDEDYDKQLYSGEMRDSLEHLSSATPKSVTGSKEISSRKELKMEASLSSWLKPRTAILENNPNDSYENLHPPRTPWNRPIVCEETSHVYPKWWDGNGIPNTITKYQEDQKVSWHATPFEERLEKALAEECFITRKHSHGKPVVFSENEESNAALSELQFSAHPKSLVLF